MRDEVLACGESFSAFAAAQLLLGHGLCVVALATAATLLVFFVFEAKSVGRAAGGYAELNFFLVEPSLVGWLCVYVQGAAHVKVKLELLHEAVIGLGHRAGYTDES